MKKITNKTILLSTTLLLIISMTITAYANNHIKINIDGKMTGNTSAEIKDDRVHVPLRFVSETMGHLVDWNGDTSTAILDNGKVKVPVGTNLSILEDGTILYADTNSYISNDRTMVGLRMVSDALGYEVDWDGNTSTVYINSTKDIKPSEEPKKDEKVEKNKVNDFYDVTDTHNDGTFTVKTTTGENVVIAEDKESLNKNDEKNFLTVVLVVGEDISKTTQVKYGGAKVNIQLLESYDINAKVVKDYGDFITPEDGILRLIDIENGAYKVTLLETPAGVSKEQIEVSTYPDWADSAGHIYGKDSEGNSYRIKKLHTILGNATGSIRFYCLPE